LGFGALSAAEALALGRDALRAFGWGFFMEGAAFFGGMLFLAGFFAGFFAVIMLLLVCSLPDTFPEC